MFNRTILIKTGITRYVILTKKYAIKFPNPSYSMKYWLKGWIANIMEKDIWEAFNSEGIDNQEIKYLICPVLKQYLWGFISVMPKCEPITIDEFPEESKLTGVCGDYKLDNYGKYKGRIVCFDYGQ